MNPRIFQLSSRAVVAYASALTALIATTDWRVEINATLGFLAADSLEADQSDCQRLA